jgi:hypothetical protein
MSVITLKNAAWDHGVHVVVHVGNGPDAEKNPSKGQIYLVRNASWAVDCGPENLQYKRDLDPNSPDGRMSAWMEIPNSGDQVVEIG